MSQTHPVGLIGIGLMGLACAKRLRLAGFALLGYDVDETKISAFTRLGGLRASSVEELARDCHKIVLCVFNTEQVEHTISTLASARAPGQPPLIVVCVSTCDPDRISALVARTAIEKIRYIEAPVSGTSVQTEKGEALGLIGGELGDVDQAADLLNAICPHRQYLGAAGNGGRAKLAINLILGINRAALAEGLVLAKTLGLDTAAFLKVAALSAAQSQVMQTKGPKMVIGDFTAEGFIAQTRKDFMLMIEQAGARQQLLPFAQTYLNIVDGCVAAGQAQLDNAIIIEEIRRRKSS